MWGGVLLHDWWFARGTAQSVPRPWERRVLAVLLILGVLGTAYEGLMIRMATFLHDRWQLAGLNWMDADGQFGKRTYALRSAYEALQAQLPASAVIQHNPVAPNSVTHSMYSEHDAVAGTPDCGIAFGGDSRECTARVRNLSALFTLPGGVPEDACRAYALDVLIAQDTDPAWHDPSSWIWLRRPVVANDYVRAFSCGAMAAGIRPVARGVGE
jgi:hypothetical protein